MTNLKLNITRIKNFSFHALIEKLGQVVYILTNLNLIIEMSLAKICFELLRTKKTELHMVGVSVRFCLIRV